jgi:hypothetical protein
MRAMQVLDPGVAQSGTQSNGVDQCDVSDRGEDKRQNSGLLVLFLVFLRQPCIASTWTPVFNTTLFQP